MTEIKFVKLLDKNKFAFTAKNEWRTIEITNKLSSKYVNISPYYMLDTDEYDLIEDVEFIVIIVSRRHLTSVRWGSDSFLLVSYFFL